MRIICMCWDVELVCLFYMCSYTLKSECMKHGGVLFQRLDYFFHGTLRLAQLARLGVLRRSYLWWVICIRHFLLYAISPYKGFPFEMDFKKGKRACKTLQILSSVSAYNYFERQESLQTVVFVYFNISMNIFMIDALRLAQLAGLGVLPSEKSYGCSYCVQLY